MKLLLGNRVVLLGLLELEFELFALTVALPLLVLLPVLNTLLVPFLHETGISLQLVDLDAPHFLLPHGCHLAVFRVRPLRHTRLPLFLFFKFSHVRFHVELFLGLVESVDALLEELVLNTVVLLLRVGNFLGGLVVSKLASFGQHGDIGGGIDLFEHHLELVEESEGNATLAFHDLVYHLGVELDVKVTQSRLQFLKVLQSVRYRVPIIKQIFKSCNDCFEIGAVRSTNLLLGKFFEIRLLIELPEKLAEEIPTGEVLLEVVDFLRSQKSHLAPNGGYLHVSGQLLR